MTRAEVGKLLFTGINQYCKNGKDYKLMIIILNESINTINKNDQESTVTTVLSTNMNMETNNINTNYCNELSI